MVAERKEEKKSDWSAPEIKFTEFLVLFSHAVFVPIQNVS